MFSVMVVVLSPAGVAAAGDVERLRRAVQIVWSGGARNSVAMDRRRPGERPWWGMGDLGRRLPLFEH
jgi:hypothetical protein